MSDNAIEVSNITKIYKLYDKPLDRLYESLGVKKNKHKEFYALKDVSFNIYKGETVGIIGTNGSGKSTLLKIITGVLGPTEGIINVEGRISALLELGAGFNGEYTGIENIYLNGTMMGYSREEIDVRMDNILKFADIGDFIHQPVKSYSSGMFVRLAFAVAINIDPEILIVDEALSVGDVFFQSKCYKKFEEFKEKGKTILFVSHDLSSIMKYCDRVILLNQGENIAEGRPKEIIDLYKKILTSNPKEKEESVHQESDYSNDKQLVEKKSLNVNPESLEYGNKMAEIIDFSIRDKQNNLTNSIEKGTEFKIIMKVKFYEEIEDPIFAFTIKDIKGVEITGTNTLIEQTEIGNIESGIIKEIVFKQNMSLQGGEYLLSLGCTGFYDGQLNVYHRLYDVCNITVISEKNTVGYYDMSSLVKVK